MIKIVTVHELVKPVLVKAGDEFRLGEPKGEVCRFIITKEQTLTHWAKVEFNGVQTWFVGGADLAEQLGTLKPTPVTPSV